ncbi:MULTISPECIES: bifunctional acetate--CoA ligase family protein/GNAT family N-acetyltransferase [unclassified Undibacterium]|uniref:bifunctional acetate--CoA ligase family protein/GNAT family N-acetyltransferase n=1 Tax=unclassified Undibacterium TaxID=2630295 RepID=UPI002AC9B6B4|nr:MULTISPECIES: bifunctional acetate--CoA ligase family protein/GNAT family N-acetyltransferase [unclassified Undibacterium]MEB0139137.1 bifunctional acetate--CoA ligase family protein/GNAT family N-acetyltransferase [Undibacterium sp. CCC2.1]MEB0172883.1 bifunctional acetate--CoA ligase family protein/GNAT family N-acetyltransferase [Undibacterium sp. CCC1.1]MEB0176645.1 bifunctional acetate--CoA ligase family protein/GNAT family N-acetyltransferase [Undibacterium sp. CCC3.4]MEB0216027.1 bifu
MDKHYLSALFAPRSLVVFAGTGEAEQTPLARVLSAHLAADKFAGQVSFLDIGMSGTHSDLVAARADLVLIALPDEQLCTALDFAGRLQCKAVLIISHGVAATMRTTLHQIASQHGIFLLGPNSMGFQIPKNQLNASTLGRLAKPGGIAVLSQSGALASSILDWAAKGGIGFSAVISLGPDSAVDLADALDYLAQDRHTQSIVVYLEGIRNARRFMSALRAAANAKPVIILKANHSGVDADSFDAIFDTALQRAGAVRVRSLVQLFAATKCLSARHLPIGRRLAIISNGGGPAVLALDAAHALGLQPVALAAAAAQALAAQLSPLAQLSNILDLGHAADAGQFRAALEACAHSNEIDGILVILSPTPGTDDSLIAHALAEHYATLGKPLLTCWMGDEQVAQARTILHRAAIPSFRTPEAAVDAFHHISRFHQNQQLLRQVPAPLSQLAKPDLEGARILIESVLAERRRVLTEMESKALLSAFHIPVTKTILARSANEAMLVANQLAYPVALKIDAPDISHKSEVQGVALNILNGAGVRDTWQTMMATVSRLRPEARINGVTVQNMSGKPLGRELYIGMLSDPLFGPVIAFGAGGVMSDLIADRALELPPLNQFLAQGLIARARAAAMLGPWHGAAAVQREALEQILLRVSEMVCALPQLRELDINPVIVDHDGALVVDARIVVDHAPAEPGNYQHLAISPYPSDRETEWPLRDGSRYIVRPLHPHDADMLQALVRGLSEESRYFRFVSSMRELSERMLAQFTLIDYDREMALVAIYPQRSVDEHGRISESECIIGVSRYVTNPDKSSCEFSLLIADQFSGQGLGSRMMMSIIDVARSRGLSQIEGLVLSNNSGMLKLMRSLGFRVGVYEEDRDFKLCVKTL